MTKMTSSRAARKKIINYVFCSGTTGTRHAEGHSQGQPSGARVRGVRDPRVRDLGTTGTRHTGGHSQGSLVGLGF